MNRMVSRGLISDRNKATILKFERIRRMGLMSFSDFDLARGADENVGLDGKFGYFGAVTTGGDDIWTLGGAYSGHITAGASIEAISDDGNDDDGGSGCQIITVQGLAPVTLAEISADINMNGTDPTAYANKQFFRVNRFFPKDGGVGTYHGNNAGNIWVRTAAGITLSYMEAGLGQTEQSHFCVPAGKRAYLDNLEAYVETTKAAELRLWQSRNADDVTTPFSPKRLVRRFTGLTDYTPHDLHQLEIEEKTDVWLEGISSAGTAAVATVLDYKLSNI